MTATLVLRNGAVDEPADAAGATVLAARALPEGTEHYDAIGLVEASERLGASLHAEASWDSMSAGVEVPGERLEAALELLAEMVGRPTFPDSEVERLRDERLNDILQARADPRRRAEEAFVETDLHGRFAVPPAGRRPRTDGRAPRRGRAPCRLAARHGPGQDHPGRRGRPDRARHPGDGRATVRRLVDSRPAPGRSRRSWPGRRLTRGSSGSSTARDPCRRRSASAIPGCLAGSPTSTLCRS